MMRVGANRTAKPRNEQPAARRHLDGTRFGLAIMFAPMILTRSVGAPVSVSFREIMTDRAEFKRASSTAFAELGEIWRALVEESCEGFDGFRR